MGLMDRLFGAGEGGVVAAGIANNAPQSPAGVQQPANPAANPAANSGTPAATQAPAGTPDKPGSSLDAFTKLWETPVNDKGEPVTPPADPLASNIFNFDPVKIREQAAALDFTKDIKPELLEGLVENGQLNATNLLQLLNTVQQNAFAAATLSTGNMVNQAMQRNNANVKAALPASIRATQLNDIPVDNPVLSHPAVQPLVGALRVTAFNKNPNANPAEVAKQVNDYIVGLATAMAETGGSSGTGGKGGQAAPTKTDWGAYFGS